jgi:predicted Zn-dependent protease
MKGAPSETAAGAGSSANAADEKAAVGDADLPGQLEQRAPGQWELYAKTAESWESVSTPAGARGAWRREQGWAARAWEGSRPRFAAATSPEGLLAALADAGRFAPADEPPPEWPSRVLAAADVPAATRAPDLFDELARSLAEASGGACVLSRLAVRSGTLAERIKNGAGLDVAQSRREIDGVATATARRGERAGEVRIPFRGPDAPDLPALARRLNDAVTLPLGEPSAPPPRGEWLLDPAVGAAILAGIAPLFTAPRPPRWIARGSLAAPDVAIADDASAEAPFDGEGVATRRVLLVEDGQIVGGLRDLRSAKRSGLPSTGHGVRPSYRTPPAAGPRRLFFETKTPRPAAELLASVRRGVYASALISPPRFDVSEDRYAIEFTGIALVAGRAKGPIPAARTAGRLSELLHRIQALATDRQYFPLPFAAGAPTMLIERASFE